MTPPLPLPFPGSQTVAAWWRELAPHQPLRLWLSHLLFHRVEALAEVARPFCLKGLQLELLRCLSAGHSPAGLEPGLRSSLTRELIGAGLLAHAGTGLVLTETGRQAVVHGSGVVRSLERKTLHFLDNEGLNRPPHLLRVSRRGAPVTPPDPWEFDPSLLQEAALQSDGWKEQFGFPAELVALHLPQPDSDNWRSIILDRAEHFFLALIETQRGNAGTRLLGFAARVEGWALEPSAPAVEIGQGWGEVLPDLSEPSEEVWREAWLARGERLGLLRADMSACRVDRSGLLLRVAAPAEVLPRLRGPRGGLADNDAWLLAGEGRTRTAARVELVQLSG